jgi:hypothetical protein
VAIGTILSGSGGSLLGVGDGGVTGSRYGAGLPFVDFSGYVCPLSSPWSPCEVTAGEVARTDSAGSMANSWGGGRVIVASALRTGI